MPGVCQASNHHHLPPFCCRCRCLSLPLFAKKRGDYRLVPVSVVTSLVPCSQVISKKEGNRKTLEKTDRYLIDSSKKMHGCSPPSLPGPRPMFPPLPKGRGRRRRRRLHRGRSQRRAVRATFILKLLALPKPNVIKCVSKPFESSKSPLPLLTHHRQHHYY